MARAPRSTCSSTGGKRHKRMLYRLMLTGAGGRELTLSGFKDLETTPTSTCGATPRGCSRASSRDTSRPIRPGTRRPSPPGSCTSRTSGLRMLSTFRGHGGVSSSAQFAQFFVRGLDKVYGGPVETANTEELPAAGGARRPLARGAAPGQWHLLLPYTSRSWSGRSSDSTGPLGDGVLLDAPPSALVSQEPDARAGADGARGRRPRRVVLWRAAAAEAGVDRPLRPRLRRLDRELAGVDRPAGV